MIEAIVRRAEEALAKLYKRQGMREKYRSVFGTPEGRLVLQDICKQAGLGKCAFHKEERDTTMALGRQHLAISILRFMEMDDSAVIEQIRKDTTTNE